MTHPFNQPGYKRLLFYKLASIAFTIGWEFVPIYYNKHEDARQRDQIKQALRSYKQNLVEGSSKRSLSSMLKLYDVSKSSSMEAIEDFEDILNFEELTRWHKQNSRLTKLRYHIESYPSPPPSPSNPSISSIKKVLGGIKGQEVVEAVVNYEIDLLVRGGYLLDKQINAVETKHTREGGYRENLLVRRLNYKKHQGPQDMKFDLSRNPVYPGCVNHILMKYTTMKTNNRVAFFQLNHFHLQSKHYQ